MGVVTTPPLSMVADGGMIEDTAPGSIGGRTAIVMLATAGEHQTATVDSHHLTDVTLTTTYGTTHATPVHRSLNEMSDDHNAPTNDEEMPAKVNPDAMSENSALRSPVRDEKPLAPPGVIEEEEAALTYGATTADGWDTANASVDNLRRDRATHDGRRSGPTTAHLGVPTDGQHRGSMHHAADRSPKPDDAETCCHDALLCATHVRRKATLPPTARTASHCLPEMTDEDVQHH